MNKSILHWSYHNMKSIPTDLLNYKELEEVYLKENYISSIPQWLLGLVNLKFIHLLGNHIREIPENIYHLENLEFLDLSSNRLTSLPDSIGRLVNLRRFNVGDNEIRILPKEIGDLMKLEILDLSTNLLKYLPAEIARLKNLKEIILNDNYCLRTLPNRLFILPNLNNIYADRCGLLYLPSVLSKAVTHVRLFNNRMLTHIPICYLEHINRFYNLYQINYESRCYPSTHFLICEEETFLKLIIPSNVRRIYRNNTRTAPSLYEICLRTIGKYYEMPLNENTRIPNYLLETLNCGPASCCSNCACQNMLYSEYYLLLVKRLNSTSKLIFSCTFCSVECMESWQAENKNEYYNVKWNPDNQE